MANNNSIFVPQTFNGARMVNVSKRTPTPSSSSTSSTNATPESTTLSHPTVVNKEQTTNRKDNKSDIQIVNASPKSKVIAIKPYASSQSVIDTRAKPTNTNRASTSSSKQQAASSPPQQQQFQHQHQQSAPIPVQPRPSQPQQVIQPQQQPMHPQVITQPSFPSAYDVAGFDRVWSEANIAVLIQLHRKHYNGVTSMDVDKYNAAWAALTSEYNAITADNRSKHALIRKWGKLMAKYNAERAFLIMPRPQGLQQPLPSVSYWNHFQYMDSYLNHVPVPENCIHKRKRRENEDDGESSYRTTTPTPLPTSGASSKRPRISDLNMELLETQRVFMEKTLDKQNTQIEMMKANVESMHEMNMKFVNICEKACTKSQVNEERYLNLLEKCLLLSNSNKENKADAPTAAAAAAAAAAEITSELEAKKQTDASPRTNSPTLSTCSSTSPELAKAEVE
ncbi:hypothetical protein INT46_001210 [Mucor plumbeus]|uniref:Myb/SANT-like DNA-binding domain-containing protein n=1 Tax=Mucor plumbeus TaxID=97098 RepID=A0A8H7UUX1_9FUNG|nr:hypothetical protein INT46_001210 [Mucor plumbeus]